MAGRGRSATSEVTKTTSPRRRATMSGSSARTSRWVPAMLTASTPSSASGSVSRTAPAMLRAALETTISTSPEGGDRGGGEPFDRVAVGQVEVDGHGLAPVGPDAGGGVLAARTPAGPRARPGGPARRGRRRWPDRCPTRRRSPRRVVARGWAGTRHQRMTGSTQGDRGGQGGEAPHVDRVDPLDAGRVDVVGRPPGRPARRGRSGPRGGPAVPPCRSGARCRS